MYEQGISGMRFSISDTAEYGDLTRGPRVINQAVRDEMGRILGEIQDGTFAKEWVAENANGRPNYKALPPGRPRPPHREGRRRAPGHDAVRHRRQAEDPGRLRRLSQAHGELTDGAVPDVKVEGLEPTFRHHRRPRRALAAGQGHPQRRRHHLVGVGEVAGLLARSPVPLALRPMGPGHGHPAGTGTSAPTSSSSSAGRCGAASAGARPAPTSNCPSVPPSGPSWPGPRARVLLEVMMGDPRSWGDDPDSFRRGTARTRAPRPSPTRPSISRRGSRTSASDLGRRRPAPG